jgi:hypothetical protein
MPRYFIVLNFKFSTLRGDLSAQDHILCTRRKKSKKNLLTNMTSKKIIHLVHIHIKNIFAPMDVIVKIVTWFFDEASINGLFKSTNRSKNTKT